MLARAVHGPALDDAADLVDGADPGRRLLAFVQCVRGDEQHSVVAGPFTPVGDGLLAVGRWQAFKPQFQSATFDARERKLRAAMFLQDECADCPKGYKAASDLLDSIVHEAEPVDAPKPATRK